MSQFYIFICDCFKAVQNRVIFANFVSNSNQQKLLNPNPGHPLLSPTSCSLIAFFGSWVSLRVRTNFQTLLARSCEVSSSVRGFQCMYVLYRAQMAFFHGLDSFKNITKLLRLYNAVFQTFPWQNLAKKEQQKYCKKWKTMALLFFMI